MTIKRDDLKNLLLIKSPKTEIMALEKIIDGHLLMLKEFPDPDHPDINKNKVFIVFQGSMPRPAVQKVLKEKYKKAGWDLVFERDWRTNGPLLILFYKESLDKRKQNIQKRFEGYGHKLAPWEKEEGESTWSTRCVNKGCNLEFDLRQGDPRVSIFTGQLPVQRPVSCPCTRACVLPT